MRFKEVKINLFSFLSKPFSLIDDTISKLFLIFFAGLFSTIFIFYYNPFNISQIEYGSAIGNYLPIWTVGGIGIIILSISQFILRPILKLQNLNVGEFILWSIFEIFFLCIGVFFFFGEFKEPFITEFLLIGKYTISISIIPYFMIYLMITIWKLKFQLKQKNKIISQNEKKSEDHLLSTITKQKLFFKENGDLLFGIQPEKILYLKSDNNYISIFFVNNEKVEKKLIRSNLKSIEQNLTISFLLRVHRSYMININRVITIQPDRGNYILKLDKLPNLYIKVSKSYKEKFDRRINAKV